MPQRTTTAVICAFVASAIITSSAFADGLPQDRAGNWHRFRGPEGTGVAPQANPPLRWSEDSNIKWKVAIPGRGSASPVVWGDRVYLATAVKTDRTTLARAASQASKFHLVQMLPPQRELGERGEPRRRREGGDRPRRRRGGFGFGGGGPPSNVHEFVVLCLDRNTGDVIWQETACEAIPHEGHHGTASFASSTPVTDGRNLYISFGSRGIYSYDMDGNFRWKRDLGKMYTRNSFGEGASPALYGDTLIINWDQEQQSFIVALDADSGEIQWKADRDEATSWASPFVIQHSGRTQVIVNGSNRVRSYDLSNGELIWECGGQAMNPVATPVVYEDVGIFMTGRRGYAVQAIKLDSLGDVTDSNQVAWELRDGTPYVPSPILYGDRLYFTKSNNAILTCVDAGTGEVLYKNQRIEGLDGVYSSHVGAAGRIYISGRNGATVVIKDGPEYEVLGKNEIGETIDATLALVGNEIFLRGEQHLFCIAEE